MGNRAEVFADRAARYSRDRNRLAGDGEAVARYVLECARRVEALSPRAVSDADREAALARIWASYEVVSSYLDSSAPYNLDSPEVPLYGDLLDGLDADWDGCPGQVEVDRVYEGT
jgi:hypothetical protein